MAKITKQMRTETAHRLDGHPARCRFIHGHSYLWEVTVHGEVGASGMIIDFSELKALMERFIDPFDHALVLQHSDPMAIPMFAMVRNYGFSERVILTPYRPTAENMAQQVAKEIVSFLQLPITVKLWETATSYAEVYAEP